MLQQGDVRGLVRKYSDVGLALVVVAIVGMMIIPLPTFILDLLIAINMTVAVTLLLVAIYVSEALKIATFPTLLAAHHSVPAGDRGVCHPPHPAARPTPAT